MFEVCLYEKGTDNLISSAKLTIKVTKRPDSKSKSSGTPHGGSRTAGWAGLAINSLPLIPIDRSHRQWEDMGWGNDQSKHGFSIRMVDGRLQIYYNKELPEFLNMLRVVDRYNLGGTLKDTYEVHLLAHAAMAVDNGGPPDVEALDEHNREQAEAYFAAVAKSLVLTAETEVTMTRKLTKAESEAGLVNKAAAVETRVVKKKSV